MWGMVMLWFTPSHKDSGFKSPDLDGGLSLKSFNVFPIYTGTLGSSYSSQIRMHSKFLRSTQRRQVTSCKRFMKEACRRSGRFTTSFSSYSVILWSGQPICRKWCGAGFTMTNFWKKENEKGGAWLFKKIIYLLPDHNFDWPCYCRFFVTSCPVCSQLLSSWS